MLALTVLTGLAVALDAPVPLRTPVVLAFFLVVPGLAIVDLLPMEDGIVRAAVCTSISVTAAVLVGLAMVAVHWWHPKAGLAFLGVVSASLVVGRAVRSRSTPRTGATPSGRASDGRG